MLSNENRMLNAVLGLPKAFSEFTRRGERRVAGEVFRSLDATPVRISLAIRRANV